MQTYRNKMMGSSHHDDYKEFKMLGHEVAVPKSCNEVPSFKELCFEVRPRIPVSLELFGHEDINQSPLTTQNNKIQNLLKIMEDVSDMCLDCDFDSEDESESEYEEDLEEPMDVEEVGDRFSTKERLPNLHNAKRPTRSTIDSVPKQPSRNQCCLSGSEVYASYHQTMQDLGCPEEFIIENPKQRMPSRVSLEHGGADSPLKSNSSHLTPKSVSLDFGESAPCSQSRSSALTCQHSSFRFPRRVSIEYHQTALKRSGSLDYSVGTSTLPRRASFKGSKGIAAALAAAQAAAETEESQVEESELQEESEVDQAVVAGRTNRTLAGELDEHHPRSVGVLLQVGLDNSHLLQPEKKQVDTLPKAPPRPCPSPICQEGQPAGSTTVTSNTGSFDMESKPTSAGPNGRGSKRERKSIRHILSDIQRDRKRPQLFYSASLP